MTKKFILLVVSIILAIVVICVAIIVPLKSGKGSVTETDDTVYNDESEVLPSAQQTFENAFKVANDNIMVALNEDLNSIKITDLYFRDAATIDGKGHTINVFSFSTACKNVVFKNIHIINNVSSKAVNNMILIGGQGGSGATGTTGSTGSKGSDKNLVFATAQQGATGGTGGAGGTGGMGAIPIVLGVDNKIRIEKGNVTITSGAGGNGGQGGQGGQGGSGGNTDAWKATAGKGGTGGTGGTGGDARYGTIAMSIELFDINEGVKLTLRDGVDGVPGTGGTGGPGGNGGIYTGNPSSWGSDGADGDWGKVGEKGGMV